MKKLAIFLSSALVLTACGGGSNNQTVSPIGSPNDQIDCNDQTQVNQSWYDFLTNNYLWPDELKSDINPADYSSTAAFLNAFRSDNDEYSFVLPTEQWQARTQGNVFGYGMSLDYSEANDYIRVIFVFKDSGAELGGLARGSRITEIGDNSASDIISWAKSGDARFNQVFGPDTEGHQINIKWLSPNDTEHTASITKGSINANTVMATTSIDTNIGKVGYLSFQHGFNQPSAKELDVAFTTLRQANVSELILDLRYNGGGRVDISGRLAAYIAGQQTKDQVYLNYIYNNTVQQSIIGEYGQDALVRRFDDASLFDPELGASNFATIYNNALNLNRVVILTSAATCSASELVINGLAPYIDVVTIGSTTCGKPAGMVPTPMCDETMVALNFQTTNADNFGDYFQGIAPNCTVSDETVKDDWASLNDTAYATAISYLEQGSCPVTAASQGYRPLQSTQGLAY
ncbi:S41 family peptidase [Saccharobesus litoralis]|nr:S41 family peptidase [Saccharobesus litoralis]